MLTKKESIKSEVKTSKTSKTASPTQTHEHSNSCCQPLSKTISQQITKHCSSPQANHQKAAEQTSDKKAGSKTRLTIKYDAGFPNQLYIRGKGANLSWEKGQPLKNVKADEWIWETETSFTHCEFKILINDQIYENGDNHLLNPGANLLFTPHFS